MNRCVINFRNILLYLAFCLLDSYEWGGAKMG